MAESVIPRLDHLGQRSAVYNVSEDFVERFVKLHGEDWIVAERHWERIVSKVLNTDAVDPHASRRRAIRQAVAATVLLLEGTILRERCPECAEGRPRRKRPPFIWWRR